MLWLFSFSGALPTVSSSGARVQTNSFLPNLLLRFQRLSVADFLSYLLSLRSEVELTTLETITGINSSPNEKKQQSVPRDLLAVCSPEATLALILGLPVLTPQKETRFIPERV